MKHITYKVIDKNIKDISYFGQLKQLSEYIANNNSAPYLYPPDDEFLIDSLSEGKTNILAFDNEKLVGYAFVKYLEKYPSYLGDLEYPINECANYIFFIVHDDYRGLGIGKELSKLILDDVKKSGRKYILTTVHPDNSSSLKAMQSIGMRVLKTKELFGEEKLIRHIMVLEL